MDKKIVIIWVIILILIFGFFFIPLPNGLTGYLIIREIPFLTVDVLSIESHYEQFPYCYSIIEGKVMNKGGSDAKDVLIDCSVLDENDGELGKTIEKVEELKKRDSSSFSIRVDVKCIPAASGQKYGCNADCSNCGVD